MVKKKKKIGVLTGGGDCPGLNAILRAVTKTARNEGDMEVIGFHDGFEGLILGRYETLHDEDVSGILTRGGTILGASNRADPFRYPEFQGDDYTFHDKSRECIRNFDALELDCLIAIGGDGTMAVSAGLIKIGLPIIGVPKTIDNDLEGTDVTCGFDTAVQTATNAIDRIHSTAQSHHRVMIVEVMGRRAGWLALASGLAGGGDIILLPEFPYDIHAVCDHIKMRNSLGKRFSIVVAGEGTRSREGKVVVKKVIKTSPEKIRLGGISHHVAEQIEDLIHMECRVTILGHLVRGGSPTSRDRLLATSFGCEAAHMAKRGETGKMVALKDNRIDLVPIEQIAGRTRLVTPRHRWVKAARDIGLSVGVPKDMEPHEYLEQIESSK